MWLKSNDVSLLRAAILLFLLLFLLGGHLYFLFFAPIDVLDTQGKLTHWISVVTLVVIALPFAVGVLFVGRGFQHTLAFLKSSQFGGLLVICGCVFLDLLALSDMAGRSGFLAVALRCGVALAAIVGILGCVLPYVGALIGEELPTSSNSFRTYHCGKCRRQLNMWNIYTDMRTRSCPKCGTYNYYNPVDEG